MYIYKVYQKWLKPNCQGLAVDWYRLGLASKVRFNSEIYPKNGPGL